MAGQKSIMHELPLLHACSCTCLALQFLRLSVRTPTIHYMHKHSLITWPSVGSMAFSEKLRQFTGIILSVPVKFWRVCRGRCCHLDFTTQGKRDTDHLNGKHRVYDLSSQWDREWKADHLPFNQSTNQYLLRAHSWLSMGLAAVPHHFVLLLWFGSSAILKKILQNFFFFFW